MHQISDVSIEAHKAYKIYYSPYSYGVSYLAASFLAARLINAMAIVLMSLTVNKANVPGAGMMRYHGTAGVCSSSRRRSVLKISCGGFRLIASGSLISCLSVGLCTAYLDVHCICGAEDFCVQDDLALDRVLPVTL